MRTKSNREAVFMSVGSRIFELRMSKNLSQSALADMLDVSRQSVSKWETDSAVPDLDKLMKLCDVFEVTLDALTGRTGGTNAEPGKTEISGLPARTQQVFGYILFALSFSAGLLLLFRGRNEGDFIIMVPVLLALLICGMICIFLKQRALYWCIWTALAPTAILTPYTVGFRPFFLVLMQVCCIAGMAFAALHFFKNVFVSANRRKGILLIAAWLAAIAMYLLNFGFAQIYGLLSVVLNFVIFALIAGLETYTVCYIRSLRH